MKYFIHLAYKGTNYRGWQTQPNAIGVQAILEETLARMMGRKINIIGCGRTDAGVHASQFFAHIVMDNAWTFDPVFRWNKMLPDDIAIFDIFPVEPHIHAQHNALERTYTYFIHFHSDPFLNEISTLYSKRGLDIEKMKKAIRLLTQYEDYQTFCKQPAVYKSTFCQVSEAKLWENSNESRLCFQITANRFLRGMVRLLIGNLLEVGYGKTSLATFQNYLDNQEQPKFFKAAYPQGLYLSKVKYDFLELSNQSELFKRLMP